MSGLAAARADLAGIIAAAGLRGLDHVAGRIAPPVVLIVPGDPYIEPPDSYNTAENIAHIQLHVVAPAGRNAGQTTELDAMLDALLGQLAGTAWFLDSVSAPFLGRIDDREFPAVRMNVSTLYERKP